MAPNILSLASSVRTLNPQPSLGYQFRYPLPMKLRNCVCAGRSSKEEHRRTQQSASLSRLPCPPRLRDAHGRKLMQFLLRTIIDGEVLVLDFFYSVNYRQYTL